MYGIESSSKIKDGFPKTVTDIIKNVVITNGYYRPNRFVVFLPDKYIPGGQNSNNKKTIMMNCSAVTVPGMNFSTVERREGAQTFKVPYDYVIEDINMTFNCSDAFLERQYFNYWFSDVFNPAFRSYNYFKSGKTASNNFSTKGYAQNFDIVLLSDLAAAFLKNAKGFIGGDTLPLEVFHVKIFDAFPKNLSPMNLNYESSDVIGTFDVQMSCLNVATSNKFPLADWEGDFADIYLATLADFTAKYGASLGGANPADAAAIIAAMSNSIMNIASLDINILKTRFADWSKSVVGDLLAGLIDMFTDWF